MQMPIWMKWAIALAVGLGIIALGWRLSSNRIFFFILPTFFVINCLVLIVVVLLQSGKAADLAGAFGGAGSQTAFGPRGAASALSSATTWCAIMFMICALALFLRSNQIGGGGSGSVLQQISKPAPAKPATPPPTTPVVPKSQTPAPQSNAPASQPPQPAPAQPPKP
jgi:preprotein translocase subunit SecG